MVTKGIITSIDFNGNTCQVRIPLFETAGNDPIISTAIVSNTPGSYNGYKVGDVVLVAFEDGKMETPVVIGKLYLGAEKEKADPRGSLNTESLVAAKTAAVPADTKLTTNTDKNLPNTMNPYANLSSIANNLNKLNTDVNYLDVFTNNQFSSVITDVNKQGDELRSEIKQTASNIEAKVDKKHGSTTTSLGWDLDEKEWKISAQDTVNGVVKDINIVTIDRSGMSIAGDLKLNGYPKNIIVRYAQNGSDKDYPNLYNFKQVDFPGTKIDKTWYHDKYIKIIEAGKEKYILISSENINNYTITPGETKAYIYNLEETNPEWKTETPTRVDGQYIWQWTHTESFLFNGDKWTEQDDDKVVCITGARGEKGDQGDAGYNTVTVMLYKRSKTSISDNPISDDLYYKFSDQKLYTNEECTAEYTYTLPTDWSYTISDTGDSSNGDLYCIAAVAHSNTDSDSIMHSEWVGPTLYVENGADGKPGVYIKEVKQWYILKASSFKGTEQELKDIKPSDNAEPTYNPAPTPTTVDKWMSTPPEAVNGYNIWTCYGSIFSDDIPSDSKKRHIEYSIPVKDAAYALAQGKTTNYYSPTEPVNKIKIGDCWFDTGYVNVGALKNKTDYLGKFVISTTGDILAEQDENDSTRYIPNATGSTRLTKITPENIETLIKNKTIVVDTTEAFETGNLKQCSSLDANGKAIWTDIAGELVTNKLTANYINALDITTKKIHVKDTNGNTLFKANGIAGEEDSNQVTIGGFSVTKDALVGGKINTQNYCKLNILDTFKVGETNNKISSSSLVIEDPTWAEIYCDYYNKDNANKSGEITWKKAAYDENAGTKSQQCLYNGLTTYKCNGDNALKNETVGNPIISCMVLKPNKELIESKIKEALNIKDGEPIPTVTFSTTLNLGISSPSYIDSTINNNYDYIIASTPFSLADLDIEIGPDITDKDKFIQNKIKEAIEKIVDLNVAKTNVDEQGKHKLSTGIFTGDKKIQEYARATGPRSIGSLENLTKVIYPSLTTDHYIAIFMVNIQKNYFSFNEDLPIGDYDSSGNRTGWGNTITDDNDRSYILPTYGYCCVPNSVEVALQTLEIGPNFKVKTDGTMFANNAFFTGAVNVPETAVIGGFNISKNTLTSSTLNIDSNKVTISSFKPLVLGSNFKLISAPDTIYTTTQKSWISKISSRNPLEILGESSIRLSNTIALKSADNASILLETVEADKGTATTSASQEIRVVTTSGTKLSPGFNLHFDKLIGTGGAVPINYFTRATITATVYSSSATDAKEEAAKEAYKITVYYKFGTTWSSTTLAIPANKTSASTTVSASGTSTYPTYYGISKNSSSEAVIADAKNPLKYTVYYTNSDISYTPKITANGALTVKGDTTTTGALTVKGNIKTSGALNVEGNVYGLAFYANSDRELKTNIENINLDSNLDKFYQQLQPVKFNFKTDLNAQHFGFIAQDLKEALSIISTDNAAYSIVNKDDKTGYYRVNYNEMVALNAAQIKNIMNYIKDLQSQYESLKLKYKELEEKINENR